MVIPREPRSFTNERGRRRDYTRAPQITKAYLLGVLHDATARKTTFRIATINHEFALILKSIIGGFGRKAWIYKEGKTRNLWIVEFSKSLLIGAKIKSKTEKIDFVRGFFDAEGGIAKSPRIRFYLYFCQKDKPNLPQSGREILLQIKKYLSELRIESGVIHNPSKRVDSDYWRFYIRAKSYKNFALLIGSYHPEKLSILRMKI